MKTTSANLEPATGGTLILHQGTRFAMPRLGPWVAAAVILLGGPSAHATITTVASYDFNAPPAGATAVGSPTYANGQLVLNGSSCLSMASPISATDNFGMEVICTPTANDTFNYSLSLNSGANNGWGILQRFGAYQGIEEGIGYFGNAGAGSAVLNVPVRLALVRAGGVTRIYRNGLAVGTSSTVNYSTLTKFTIGGNQLTAAPVFEGFFRGSIDEVRVFTFAPGAFNPVTDLPNRTVVTTTVDEDNGSLVGGAGISLREAVNHSPANSRITFDPSLSGKTITLTQGQLLITKSLTIDATSLPNGLTINANGAVTNHRVMEIQPNSTVALHGLTLTGGRATGVFPANSGGAIFANGPGAGNSVRLSLSSCTLSGNSATNGGGIYSNGNNGGSATLSLASCTLSGNSTSFGGGIYSNGENGSATLSLSSCTLSGNSASNGGGGILSNGLFGSATLSLSSCTLSGNSASEGGGILSSGQSAGSATLSLSSCTLSGNSASYRGGGIFSDGLFGSVTLNLNSSILAGNTASSSGPDLWQGTIGATATTTATGNNLISNTEGSNIQGTPNLIVAAPLLSPLGHYGGPTQTMHPLSGSPAVLTSANVTRTDQRGFTLTGPPTIGAVMQGPVITVTNEGSLRTELANSANTKGRVIRFASSLSGQTITLTTGQLLVPGNTNGLFIDASSLPNGLTINANGAVTNHRVMEIQPNSTVALRSLTLTGGRALATAPGNLGGAIYADGAGFGNSVRLDLSSCTLSGNSASFLGGGIYLSGHTSGSAALNLSSCTLSGNSVSFLGGGIYSAGNNGGSATLSLSSCTLSGNSATDGGGIYSTGASGRATLSLSSCTLSGNSASGSGGGIFSDGTSGSATLNLNNSILAGNTASPGGPDLWQSTTGATATATGANLISSLGGQTSLTAGASVTVVADPRLAPLANYGGRTMTMPPLPGSPAIDAAPGSVETVDQRGAPRPLDGDGNGTSIADIGAVEFDPTIIVTNTQDSGPGSLREAVNHSPAGSIIVFAPSLSGKTITLTQGQLLITKSLTIDASSLPNGLTINANRKDRVMEIALNSTVALHGLTLTGGLAGNGGAIFANGSGLGNSVRLSLTSCTLSGNSASSQGGGIYISGQSVGSATLSLSSCTLSGNSANFSGGGIYSNGRGGSATLSLSSCTISGNSAAIQGGGIYSNGENGSATLNLNNSIFAGNTASINGADLRELGTGATTTATGNNLMSSIEGSNIGAPAPATITVLTTPLLLAPLGHYGGPTMTMHPLSGSPAVLTSANVTRTDQRGFPLTGPPTIGAVMQGPVITVADQATLRTALAGSANTKGRVIRFNPSLSGQTIPLTTGQLLVPGLSDGLFIDASSLPNGLTINANGAVTNHRVMEIQPNSTVALHGLTLTGGRATGNSSPADSGGAIFANGPGTGNSVRLSLSSCTLSGNSASFGGGIFSNGIEFGSATLSLSSCTLSGNSAGKGGGIYSEGSDLGSATLSLSSCTLSGNSASFGGGGIYSNGLFGSATLSLSSCTLSGNSAFFGGGIFSNGSAGSATLSLSSCTLSGNSASSSGGGIFSNGQIGSATLSLNNTILAANTASTELDLWQSTTGATTTATGSNLMASSNLVTLPANITVLGTPLLLAPLGHYGGPTMTRPPLLGSPAIDAAGTTNPGGTDQRGFSRFVGSGLDIGAVEFQGQATELDLAFNEDIDQDGSAVGVELAIGTNPFLPDANDPRHFRLTSFTNGQPNFSFGIDNARQSDIILRLVRSTDLIDFNTEITTNASTNFPNPGTGLLQFDDPSAPAGKAFYRLQALRRP